jgi:hypothetical protein
MHEKYPYYVVTFPSVHHAIKLEAKLKGQGFPLRLVPVPREISSSCGVAAKVKDTNVDDIKALIAKNGLEFDAIYIYETPKQKPSLVAEGIH